MTDGYVLSVSERYIELYEKITGERFVRSDVSEITGRIERNILDFLSDRNLRRG